MKSMVMKSIYAGLGMLGTGKHSIEHLAKEISKRAQLSEKEGEKIARDLRHRSERAIGTVQKTLNSEVGKVVKALKDATETAKRKTGTHAKTSSHTKARRPARRTKRTTAAK